MRGGGKKSFNKKGRSGGPRRGPGGSGGARRMGGYRRRKVCRFCADKIEYIDYKDVRTLSHFVPERGKIQPRRISGTCARHQRKLALAIRRARVIALLPYSTH
ncbi:MAG TPA: 30S ribosomal protein S18 [Acidobacteriota bacterium]